MIYITRFAQFLIYLSILILDVGHSHSLYSIRGGLVPQANEQGGEYFELFDLDYGCDDRVRNAGFMKGFIPTGNLITKSERDPFFTWLNEHLEKGNEVSSSSSRRIKPFYVCIDICHT